MQFYLLHWLTQTITLRMRCSHFCTLHNPTHNHNAQPSVARHIRYGISIYSCPGAVSQKRNREMEHLPFFLSRSFSPLLLITHSTACLHFTDSSSLSFQSISSPLLPLLPYPYFLLTLKLLSSPPISSMPPTFSHSLILHLFLPYPLISPSLACAPL